MIDRARVCLLLETKDRIERALAERGVVLDPQARDAIGWTLKSLTEDDGYDLGTAADRILEIHRVALSRAA